MQALDAKALSILGWTSAVAALFLARGSAVGDLSLLQLLLVGVGTAAALAAVGSSFMVIKVRRSCWQNQEDWLCDDYATDAALLRSHHLLCWYDVDSANALANWDKGRWLRRAQLGLLAGAVCTALGLATALFP